MCLIIKYFIFCKLPWNQVIIGHINLLPLAFILKLRKPHIKISLITHGIEVWKPLSYVNNYLLKFVDVFISVSDFTKNKLIEVQGIDKSRIVVRANSLSPNFEIPLKLEKPKYLIKRYGLSDEKIIMSICRISLNDRYKGYVNVIKSLNLLIPLHPNLLYLICGKSTVDEEIFINNLVESLGLRNHVRLVGYLEDDELIDHYLLADVFSMPSKKEGFGIAFIEAASLGVSILAGNEDASKEALLNGDLGYLVDPDDVSQISNGLEMALCSPINKEVLKRTVIDNFAFSKYNELFHKEILS